MPVTDLFLMLFRYQLFHTLAEGMCLRSGQTENHMLEEHHCVKEVTGEPWEVFSRVIISPASDTFALRVHELYLWEHQ